MLIRGPDPRGQCDHALRRRDRIRTIDGPDFRAGRFQPLYRLGRAAPSESACAHAGFEGPFVDGFRSHPATARAICCA